MFHSDHSYAQNPLSGFLAEDAPRGIGIELRLYHDDPDRAEEQARNGGWWVLSSSRDKPGHGLRECTILDDMGYAWVISRPIKGQ